MDLSQFVEVPQAPQAQPQQQPQSPQQFQQQPTMRQTPDGSWIGNDYALEWEGYQGDAGSVVQLKSVHGQLVFRGHYGELLQRRMVGVWEPGYQQQEQPQGAMNGMGASAPPLADKHSGTKKLLGITAAGLAAGAVAWFSTKWFQGRDKGRKKRRREDE